MNKLNEITKNFKKVPIGRLSIGKLKPMFNIFLLFFLLTQLLTSLQCGGKPEEIDNVGFGVPSGLRSEPGAGQVTLIWDPVENAIYYNVYRDDSIIADPNKTFYTDMNLQGSVEYIYQVSAVDANGKEGDKSDAITVTLQFLDYSKFQCPESNFEAPTGKPLLEYIKNFTLSSDMQNILNIGNPVVITTYPINEAEVPSLPHVDFLFSEEMKDSTLMASGFAVTLYRNDMEESGILTKGSVSRITADKNIYRLSFSNSESLQHGDRVRIELDSSITDKEPSPNSIRTFLPYEFYINVDSEAITNDQTALDTSSIEFSGSDNASNVTQPFFLPTLGEDRSSLCWQTDRPDIFQIDNETGRVEVIRPLDSGASPKLRAEIKKGSETSLFKTLSVTTPMLSVSGSPDSKSLKCSLGTPQTITDAVTDLIVIPKPNSVTVDNTGQFDINCNTRFASNGDTSLEHHIIDHLNKLFSEDMGFNIPTTSDNTRSNLIKIDFLEKGEADTYIDSIDLIPAHTEDDKDNILRKEEAYKLEITKDGILITAAHKRGFINAYHTLVQLFPTGLQKRINRKKINTFPLPLVSIQDRPRLVYRGHRGNLTIQEFFTDEAERTRSIRETKKFIFGFARYKINVMKGAVVPFALSLSLLRSPRMWLHYSSHGKTVIAEIKHIRELIAYARDRNVELVPIVPFVHKTSIVIFDPDISIMDGEANKYSRDGSLYSPSQETFAMFKRRMASVSRVYGSRYIHIRGDEYYKPVRRYFRPSEGDDASATNALASYTDIMNDYNGGMYVDDTRLQTLIQGGFTGNEGKNSRYGNPKKVIWEAERFKSLEGISGKPAVERDVYIHLSNQLVRAVKERGRTPIAWDDFFLDVSDIPLPESSKPANYTRFSPLVEHDPATIVHWWRHYAGRKHDDGVPPKTNIYSGDTIVFEYQEKEINQLGHKYIFNNEYSTYFNTTYISNRNWDSYEVKQHHRRCENTKLTRTTYLPGININNSYSSYSFDVVDSDGNPTLLWGFSSAQWTGVKGEPDNFDQLEYLTFPRIFGIAEVGWSDRPSDYPSDWSVYSKTKPYEPWEDLKRRTQAQKPVLVNYDIQHFKPDFHGFIYETKAEQTAFMASLDCSIVK